VIIDSFHLSEAWGRLIAACSPEGSFRYLGQSVNSFVRAAGPCRTSTPPSKLRPEAGSRSYWLNRSTRPCPVRTDRSAAFWPVYRPRTPLYGLGM